MATLAVAFNLICNVILSQSIKVQIQGDVFPFVARATRENGARSHSCHNGTEFIVTLSQPVIGEEILDIMNSRLGTHSKDQSHSRTLGNLELEGQLNALSVCVPEGEDVEAHVQVLLALEGVEAVEENILVSNLGFGVEQLPQNLVQLVPWHLDRIDQRSLPLDGWYNAPGTGLGVHVYITDTGTDAYHPEFDGRVTAGHSVIPGEDATHSVQEHGTHVAGIVGSRDYGVAKNVTIVPVKVFASSGEGASLADIVEGINWVIEAKKEHGGPAVLSMSLGCESPSAFYAGEQALLHAVQAGIIPVVAAGNDNKDACGYWPAQSKWTITVGSTDSDDSRSFFSNYGSCVDIYAPGYKITSTLPGGKVGLMSGTSMACPVVSGVVALHLEKQPGMSFAQMKDALFDTAVGQKSVTAAQRMLLVQSARPSQFGMLASASAASPEHTMHHDQGTQPVYWMLLSGIGCVGCVVVVLAVLTLQTKKRVHDQQLQEPYCIDLI